MGVFPDDVKDALIASDEELAVDPQPEELVTLAEAALVNWMVALPPIVGVVGDVEVTVMPHVKATLPEGETPPVGGAE